MHMETKAVHVGQTPDMTTGAVVPPIYMTSTYKQESPGEDKGFDYTRSNNPNFMMLEETLASLENAAFATVFSSGLGALTAMIQLLSPGDHVLAIDGVYGGTYRLFTKVFRKFGIEFKSIPASELNNIEYFLQKKPKWLFFETPTNPLLEIFDINELSSLAKKHGILTVIDNTFATPYFQQPFSLGADIVWHSTTKYIGGHSDIIGGVVITNQLDIKKAIDFARMSMGLNPSPFDTWLLSRGVKTLPLRMERHGQNALEIGSFLEKHPLVKKIFYPGLTSHRGHEIARRQMTGFGGIISVEFNLSLDLTKKLISSFKLITLAESLGSVESLVNHPASMTHASIPPDERIKMGIHDGLVRFSIGIENCQDLISDIENTLLQLHKSPELPVH